MAVFERSGFRACWRHLDSDTNFQMKLGYQVWNLRSDSIDNLNQDSSAFLHYSNSFEIQNVS